MFLSLCVTAQYFSTNFIFKPLNGISGWLLSSPVDDLGVGMELGSVDTWSVRVFGVRGVMWECGVSCGGVGV